jgi:hypothetical protein|tara:strand:- start:169 stop:303 length:135 start_codon:yes stop_codon:yes gene_type:complete
LAKLAKIESENTVGRKLYSEGYPAAQGKYYDIDAKYRTDYHKAG